MIIVNRLIFLIVFLITISSCGKKTSLDNYPNGDYPRSYPKQND